MDCEFEEGIDKKKFIDSIPQMYEDVKFKETLDKYMGGGTAHIVHSLSEGKTIDDETIEELFDAADNAFGLSSKTAISLGWNGDAPGMSGAIWVNVVNGVYLFKSSDYETLGPFESLNEVLDLEYFDVPTPNPEISSDVLAASELYEIFSGIVNLDDSEIIGAEEKSVDV